VRAALLAVLVLLTCAVPAGAQDAPNIWFAGTQLIFDQAEMRAGTVAVGTADTGLQRFLARLGATLAYEPGQRYVVITTADRRTITFTLGDAQFTVAGASFRAPFAPYSAGAQAFLPLFALARALYVVPIDAGGETVLQPQLGALDVHNVGQTVVVTLRGATPLHFRRLAGDDGQVELLFTGVASTLDQSRIVGSPGLSQVTLLAEGTPRNPSTSVAFYGPADGVHVLGPSSSPNELTLIFAPAGTPLAGTPIPDEGDAVASVGAPAVTPAFTPPPEPSVPPDTSSDEDGDQTAASPQPGEAATVASPSPVASEMGAAVPAVVTAIDETPAESSFSVRVAVNAPVAYEWHRLLDGRWYLDLQNATLGIAPLDETPASDVVSSLRVRQMALQPIPVVRVAFTLPSDLAVDLEPSDSSLTITVGASADTDVARTGLGQIGDAGTIALAPVSSPLPSATPAAVATPWKFAPRTANAGLIVIDPGHGGSDSGAMGNGLVEKDLTLDIAGRLRRVLEARGWTVKLTRYTDVDVYQPNDSAHDELQARCDIANNAGARLFISIHVNSFTSSDLNGTTTYYYKDDSLPLAQAVHRHLAAALETKDDGIQKANFYVIHHTTMPAILIETAFLSNPGDAALLRSPTFLQKIAVSVADGVSDYAGAPPPPQTSMDIP